jgi:hypothetical protein
MQFTADELDILQTHYYRQLLQTAKESADKSIKVRYEMEFNLKLPL